MVPSAIELRQVVFIVHICDLTLDTRHSILFCAALAAIFINIVCGWGGARGGTTLCRTTIPS